MDRIGLIQIRKSFHLLARKADELEGFTAKALQLMGDAFDARCLILSVQDLRQDQQVIHASVFREQNQWRMRVDDSDNYAHFIRLKRTCPTYLFHSYFCFSIDLPSRWSGVLLIEYPGIKILSAATYQLMCAVLQDLGDSLHLVLIHQELKELETRVLEKERMNQDLRRIMTERSKEAYCVSSIITGWNQSLNVVDIFTRILGSILPLLKARLGEVYFPESDQCISFQSMEAQYQYLTHDHGSCSHPPQGTCLKEYFRRKSARLNAGPKEISLTLLSRNDSFLPDALKQHFDSLGIQSALEFSLCSGVELFGLGIIGFSGNYIRPDRSRLLMITLNMTSLFLKNSSLVKDLESQVEMKSREIREREKEQRFVFDNVTQSFSLSKGVNNISSEQILEEIDRSQKAHFLGELASGVAHQIRNPLNNLVSVLHLLKNNDIQGGEDGDQLLAQVTERVEVIHKMIDKFIQYTRIPELNLTSESINGVLKNTLHTFKAWTDLARVKVISSFDPQLSVTKLDLYLMDQVYHNIIKNALEAMYSNGSLWISTRKLGSKHGPDPHLEFSEIVFQDSGPGIPQKDINNVLTPFFSRKQDGMGLGLAIVDHVVRLHGGCVRIENRQPQGTKVTIHLPIR